MHTNRLLIPLLTMVLLLAACSSSSDTNESADAASVDESAAEVETTEAEPEPEPEVAPVVPVTDADVSCEVADDDSYFRVLYTNEGEEHHRIFGSVRFTLADGGEHYADVQSEAIQPGEVLRESYLSSKPPGSTLEGCTTDELEVETTTPVDVGLADLEPCSLAEGELGGFLVELTATNQGDEPVYYHGQVAIRNADEERVITAFYVLQLVNGQIEAIQPGETAAQTYSQVEAPFAPDHTCQVIAADATVE